MNKELYFEDEEFDEYDNTSKFEEEVFEDDDLKDSKISVARFAKIIDEFDSAEDDFDDYSGSDLHLDSLGLN